MKAISRSHTEQALLVWAAFCAIPQRTVFSVQTNKPDVGLPMSQCPEVSKCLCSTTVRCSYFSGTGGEMGPQKGRGTLQSKADRTLQISFPLGSDRFTAL